MSDIYQPIACAVHSEYELLAIHQSKVLLDAMDAQGKRQRLECHVKDICTRQGAEYLVVVADNNTSCEFRLDQIHSIKELNT